jgi:hypothetical protein
METKNPVLVVSKCTSIWIANASSTSDEIRAVVEDNEKETCGLRC